MINGMLRHSAWPLLLLSGALGTNLFSQLPSCAVTGYSGHPDYLSATFDTRGLPEDTVFDNVRLELRLSGVSKAQVLQFATQTLEANHVYVHHFEIPISTVNVRASQCAWAARGGGANLDVSSSVGITGRRVDTAGAVRFGPLPPPLADVHEGTYTLESLNSGLCLSVRTDNQRLVQMTCGHGANQLFQLRGGGGRTFLLADVSTDQCVDVQGALEDDGVFIFEYPCHGKSNQQFQFTRTGPGFAIVAQHSGKCLDVKDESRAEEAPVIQYRCHGSQNQIWMPTLIP
jgi:hypothetical protein